MKQVYGIILGCVLGLSVDVMASEPKHGICLYGEPKHAAEFKAFDYVNPKAPQGGDLRQASFGAYNSLNPFVLMGIAPDGIGLMYDTLMKQSEDENFCLYGLIAKSVELPDDRKWVAFNINSHAVFSDGSKITADDVVFSFDVLKQKGAPAYRYYYADVEMVEKTAADRVVFHFNKETTNKELPLILGELPILSKTYWDGKDFATTTLEIPVSSGPYLIDRMDVGRSITYWKNPKYWARDLNVNKGYYNFDTIRYDTYRDTTVALEAFKAKAFDLRVENEAKKWVVFKNYPSVKEGKIKQVEFKHELPRGMQGFVFNTRRDIFKSPKVREALAYAFDYNFVNTFLFYGLYTRSNSYFDNSIFKATGIPSGIELKLLEPYRVQLPASVFESVYVAPERSGNIRRNLTVALRLLNEAGWVVQDGVLCNLDDKPFEFEILMDSAAAPTWERVILPFIGQLKRLGIKAELRVVDPIQYKNRLDSFDYDMIVSVWGQSTSPGNEQRYFWGSESADVKGSYNYAGIKDPVVDAMIEKVVVAQTAEEHQAAVRALDRVLLWGHYVIPHWHSNVHRYIFWDKFGMPEKVPQKGVNPLLWWGKPL